MIKIINSIPNIEKTNTIMNSIEKDSYLDKISYISRNCSPYNAIFFCSLLFPSFVFIDGCYILEYYYTEENFRNAVRNCGGDKRKIEEGMNNTLIYEIFDHFSESVSDVVYEEIAEIIKFSWDMILKKEIPEHNFIVECIIDEQNYGPVVTFYQA
ncbi:hypothetical protein [Acetobacter sp.]|uniref:hypothetical protein n=1 Tax=Acetobacter sp. TaxID=440 RepID=UPI0039ECFB12